MIIKGNKGDVELRSQEWGSSWIIPQPGTNYVSGAGVMVDEYGAQGVPAIGNVIRSAADVVASLPFEVYRGTPRVPARDTWQWQLLNEEPDSVGTSSFSFFYDIEISIEATQNAFIMKERGGRSRIESLSVIDPQRVKIYLDKVTKDKLFDIYLDANTTLKGLTVDDVLHIRGYTARPGEVAGTSLIMLHKEAIGNSIAMQSFEGDYFKNSAQPPFWFTGAKNQAHAQELVAFHNAEHKGQGKRWSTGALWGENMDVKALPISMNDAQWADGKRISIEDACRIWRWPEELMALTSGGRVTYPADEAAWFTRIMKIFVLPRLKRIERAFAADKDLFLMSGLSGLFDTEEFQRADYSNRAAGYKNARQGGWITANEIRGKENLAPLPGGDELLITPTGSAPNPPAADTADTASQNGKVAESEVVI
jgi:HK97 family phage portal protein